MSSNGDEGGPARPVVPVPRDQRGRIHGDTSPAWGAADTASGQGRPTISVCMMVKNEEVRLPDALKSVRPWVDEIVVVDTGSTDRTMDIAREFGAVIHEHPWEHDFAKHRNQSIGYATGDWILILDADEELDQGTAPLLQHMVKEPPPVNCFLFELYNVSSSGGSTFLLHPRLFRNGVGFHYEGKVHNRPFSPGEARRSRVKLTHHGYAEDPEKMEAKHQRRVDMIRKWAEQEPDSSQAHSYLAHTLVGRPETMTEGVEEAREAIRLLIEQGTEVQRFPHAYYPLLLGLATLGRDDEVLRHSEECLRLVPVYPDPAYYLLHVYYKRQEWEKACRAAAQFAELQDRCREHPERFIFFENLTYNMINYAFLRWAVAAAQLGREDEALAAFLRILEEKSPEDTARRTVQDLVYYKLYDTARRFTREAHDRHPEWSWTAELSRVSDQYLREDESRSLRERGNAALKQGRLDEALEMFRRAINSAPLEPESLHALARALDDGGKQDESLDWYLRSLNTNPMNAEAWHRLAELSFERREYAGALAAYGRFLGLAHPDSSLTSRVEVCRRRLAAAPPLVSQSPPKLLVFLVGGLTFEMVRLPAPHFLMGTAWGRLNMPGGMDSDMPSWATLQTGSPAEVHGLSRDGSRAGGPGLTDLKVKTVWELLPPETSLGLAAAPLGHRAPPLKGWRLPGFPAGLLSRENVEPPELAAVALARNYRSDFILTDQDQETFIPRLETDVREQAKLFQTERNKLAAAAAMPAVDVLVVGFSHLEYIQRVHELADYNTFAAYQQTYAMIEAFLAGVRPENFAVLSQRSFAARNNLPVSGGFFCLSWLRGENRAKGVEAADVIREILRLMGGEVARLGEPRE